MRGDAARRARGHAPGMPAACLLGENNLTFQKTLIFRKSPQICGQAAAKAKAKACSPPWACSSQGQGQGSPHGHAAAKAKARSQGHGMLAWARWHAPGGRPGLGCLRGCGSTAWARGRGAGMPRGWDAKAVACPWDPSKAMSALGGSAAAKPS